MMEEAQAIVAMLNAPPLDLNISVLEFCQKSPSQLRQLLFYVLSAIVHPQVCITACNSSKRNDQRSSPLPKGSPFSFIPLFLDLPSRCTNKQNPRKRLEDSPESTTCWMMESLTLLNYRPSIDGTSLREGIATGNPDIIRLLLAWLLPQISMLQKRAYLARFLVDVEIPAELLVGEDINKLHAQYDALREQFKATHRHLESLRQIERDPIKVKEQVLELETEREHLQSKISKLKCKLQDMEKSDELLEAVGELKSLTMEETRLGDAINEQRQAFTRSLDKHQKASSKLQQMKTLLEPTHHAALLDKTLQEVCALRFSAKQKLPEVIFDSNVF